MVLDEKIKSLIIPLNFYRIIKKKLNYSDYLLFVNIKNP